MPPSLRPAEPRDRDEWTRMRCALWPDATAEEHGEEMEGFFVNRGRLPVFVAVLDRGDGRLGGFVEASIRPYVDGCRSDQVGYVEGWWVDDDLRRQGWGRALLERAEGWARSRGCWEMASDTHLDNLTSQRAHQASGYQEVERIVIMRKVIDQEP